mmetsp:Transcript_36112/g.83808  ORF Transcript_36112/g.83808 Transcript_36112/m.83808 type:complete len:106 (+) Transcript_36112:119-436(+)
MRASDPAQHKKLGRTVKNFDDAIWRDACRGIVERGCKAKFSQNKRLRELLLATGEKTIAEASPKDNIWGIGLSSTDPRATDPSRWRGTNWLGEVSMCVCSLGEPV